MKNSKFDRLFNTIMEEVKSSKIKAKKIIKESEEDYQDDQEEEQFDLKDARERADGYWDQVQALPEQIKNMSKEQVEESMQKITAALENDSDWEKGDDGKWEYDGYDTAAEAIAKICEDCLPIDIDCFSDYWEASDEVARLEYIEENGDDEDFEVDSTGCGYDEWITEFDEYINVGWLNDFLDSIIDWD